MLVGLAAKNAILIVEFAEQLRERGMTVVEAAIEAARLRLRPILMTSLAFILGVLPLVFATGAGQEARHSVGTAVAGGMLRVDVPQHRLHPGALRGGADAPGRGPAEPRPRGRRHRRFLDSISKRVVRWPVFFDSAGAGQSWPSFLTGWIRVNAGRRYRWTRSGLVSSGAASARTSSSKWAGGERRCRSRNGSSTV